MTRQREIPSILYRHPNLINMTFPILPGIGKIQISGAARLNDAYGNVAGVGGGGPVTMFQVLSGETYMSPSIRARKVAFEDSNRGITRMVFDPDDFATPMQAPGTSYLPTDDMTLFLRVATWNPVAGAFNPPGPIIIIPPYDFFSTKEPVFTVTGTAPNLNIAAWPNAIPDFMPPLTMNFMVHAYGGTVSVENMGVALAAPIFMSFHPGVPPTVIKADRELSMTGVGDPEFFVGAPNANVIFTVRVSIVNSA